MAARHVPPSARAGPLVQSLRLTGQLKLGLSSVHSARLRSVACAEIFERELALSIVQRAAAAKTCQLAVVRRRGFDADDLVLSFAVRASKGIRRGV